MSSVLHRRFARWWLTGIAICLASLRCSVVLAVVVGFPDEGVRFDDLAGQLGDYAWTAKRIVVRGEIDVAEGVSSGTVEIDGEGLAIHDPGFERAGENLRVGGSIEILDLGEESATLRVDLQIVSGELLVDKLYVDLSVFPVSLEGRVAVPGGLGKGDRLRFEDVVVRIAGVGAARGAGEWALDGSSGEVLGTLEVDGLPRLYDLLYSVPADQRRYRIEDRGALTAEIAYRQDAAGVYALTGAASLSGAVVAADDPQLRLSLAAAEIPLALGPGVALETIATGRIAVGESTILGGPIGATVFPIEVGPSSIRLTEPVRVPVFGGAITVSSFASTDLHSADRQLRLALAAEEVDLSQLSQSLGGPAVAGSLSATIPEIEVGGGLLRSSGEMIADVFDGRVRVRHLRGDDLGSTVPTFGFDVDFEAISLEELTRVLSFGYVSGVANGGVRGLEFVSWGPVAFEAWLETIPKSGVSQRISVDAIRQISIVGGGASDPFSQGIMRFFDEYRYAKLGFQCRLHNDVFTLDGIEVEDGAHYLVVGATIPPRVNVVSHVREISFSDMVARMATVTQ